MLYNKEKTKKTYVKYFDSNLSLYEERGVFFFPNRQESTSKVFHFEDILSIETYEISGDNNTVDDIIIEILCTDGYVYDKSVNGAHGLALNSEEHQATSKVASDIVKLLKEKIENYEPVIDDEDNFKDPGDNYYDESLHVYARNGNNYGVSMYESEENRVLNDPNYNNQYNPNFTQNNGQYNNQNNYQNYNPNNVPFSYLKNNVSYCLVVAFISAILALFTCFGTFGSSYPFNDSIFNFAYSTMGSQVYVDIILDAYFGVMGLLLLFGIIFMAMKRPTRGYSVFSILIFLLLGLALDACAILIAFTPLFIGLNLNLDMNLGYGSILFIILTAISSIATYIALYWLSRYKKTC